MPKNILFLCGGKSAEHEVSLRSTRNVISALDPQRFCALTVAISRSGSWYLLRSPQDLENITEYSDDLPIGELCTLLRKPNQTVLITVSGQQIVLDAAFPLIHGPMGEDGTLQGLLEMFELPYTGAGVLSSAIGMDKDVLKQRLHHADLPIVPFVTLNDKECIPSYEALSTQLDSAILFVKPAVMGSSVGVEKVRNAAQYQAAVTKAFHYSFKVLIEKFIPGREVECSVLGNRSPSASCVGEIKPHHDFYSYEAKYLDPNGAELIIPAQLPHAVAETVRRLAISTFQAIECLGFARVDFFITTDDKVYVNEINTLPGFTSISMYPKMWEASGLAYTDLVSHLIDLAFEAFEHKQTIHLRPDCTDILNVQAIAL